MMDIRLTMACKRTGIPLRKIAADEFIRLATCPNVVNRM